MKILVTGGAGFIGRVVLRRLTAAGHTAVPYDRALEARDDIGDPTRLRAALRQVDAVIHLAAKVGLGVGVADIDDYARINDLGTAVVLRCAAEAEVARVVLASSMVVYGEGSAECPRHGALRVPPRREADLARRRFEPRCPDCGTDLLPHRVTEDAPLDPRNGYGATKVHAEHLAAIWGRQTGARAVALRYHNVYGPGLPLDTPYAGVAAIFRSALAHGRAPRVFEDGGQRRDFVHVEDVAAATVAALDCRTEHEFTALNVGSGRVSTIGEIAAAMAILMDGPEPVLTGDYRLGDVRHITADSSAARRLLGWQPQLDLERGLATLIDDPLPAG